MYILVLKETGMTECRSGFLVCIKYKKVDMC